MEVILDELAITIEDPDHHDEQRCITIIGTDTKTRMLVMVYAYQGKNAIRIISARQADRRERRPYES